MRLLIKQYLFQYVLLKKNLLDFYDFKKVVNIVGEINKHDQNSVTLKEVMKIKKYE